MAGSVCLVSWAHRPVHERGGASTIMEFIHGSIVKSQISEVYSNKF